MQKNYRNHCQKLIKGCHFFHSTMYGYCLTYKDYCLVSNEDKIDIVKKWRALTRKRLM